MRASGAAIAVRRAGPGDRDLLLAWANDPATRAASFYPERIEADVHERWFAARLASPDVGIWIGELDDVPVGQVRVVRVEATRGEIGISLTPEARGRGLSRPLLLAGMAAAERDLGVTAFTAAIRPTNAVSLALFRAAGFSDVSEGERNGVRCTILMRPAEPGGTRLHPELRSGRAEAASNKA